MLTGGNGTHNCSVLSARTGRWHDGPRLPARRLQDHCCVALREHTVCAAGMIWPPSLPGASQSPWSFWDDARNDSTYVLAANKDGAEWVRGADMRYGRVLAGGASTDDQTRVLIGGGQVSDFCLDTLEQYDLTTDRWIDVEGCLPEKMSCRATPVAGNCVLFTRSLSASTERGGSYVIDVRAQCSVVSQSNFVRLSSYALVTISDSTAAIIGGSGLGLGNAVSLYDVRANRWCEFSQWALPHPSSGHCATILPW